MRIPLHVNCQKCKHPQYLWIKLKDSHVNGSCPQCGAEFDAGLETSITLGFKLLYRSAYELMESGDYSLSIVFSAMAFECEVTRLNKKWRTITALDKGTYLEGKDIEPLIRKYRSISHKLKDTGEMLSPKGFEKYTQDDEEFSKTIKEGFPSFNQKTLIRSFEEGLFWPRNAILHSGDCHFDKDFAMKCYNTALLGLKILHFMDLDRRKKIK